MSREVSTVGEQVLILGKSLCCALCIIFAGNASSKAKLDSTEILAVYYVLLLTTKKLVLQHFSRLSLVYLVAWHRSSPGFMCMSMVLDWNVLNRKPNCTARDKFGFKWNDCECHLLILKTNSTTFVCPLDACIVNNRDPGLGRVKFPAVLSQFSGREKASSFSVLQAILPVAFLCINTPLTGGKAWQTEWRMGIFSC